MIEQYLLNTNKSATVSILPTFFSTKEGLVSVVLYLSSRTDRSALHKPAALTEGQCSSQAASRSTPE